MVRPVEDERMLQNLASAGEEIMRPEFNQQVNTLRQKSLKKVKPKQIKGRSVNGPMLV
jgi:hypothetical protein